jgi:hypothetical protein
MAKFRFKIIVIMDNSAVIASKWQKVDNDKDIRAWQKLLKTMKDIGHLMVDGWNLHPDKINRAQVYVQKKKGLLWRTV